MYNSFDPSKPRYIGRHPGAAFMEMQFSQFFPAIAVDQATGGVAVSCYDCRNALGTGGLGDTDGIPTTTPRSGPLIPPMAE